MKLTPSSVHGLVTSGPAPSSQSREATQQETSQARRGSPALLVPARSIIESSQATKVKCVALQNLMNIYSGAFGAINELCFLSKTNSNEGVLLTARLIWTACAARLVGLSSSNVVTFPKSQQLSW